MKAHVLLNVLNHCDPQAEWDGGDILTAPDGARYSIRLSAETMIPGQSRLVLDNPPAPSNEETPAG